MKKYKLIYLLLITTCFASFKLLRRYSKIHQSSLRLDTISGIFLYEVNIPEKSYTRIDQVEQGHNFILYNQNIKKMEIEKLYESGIYCLNYETFVSNFERLNNLLLYQNKYSINNLKDSLFYFKYQNYNYKKTTIRDKSGIFIFKKFKATIVLTHLGKQRQMIPTAAGYSCCYSNMKKEINTYFVNDILYFKVY